MLNIELVIIPEEVIYTDSLASYIREVYIVYQQKIKYFLKKTHKFCDILVGLVISGCKTQNM